MKHEIFKDNPQLEVVYMTSDGTPFYKENDAKNHAKTLKNKEVEPVHNPDYLKVEGLEEIADPEAEAKKAEVAEAKAKEAEAKKAAAAEAKAKEAEAKKAAAAEAKAKEAEAKAKAAEAKKAEAEAKKAEAENKSLKPIS